MSKTLEEILGTIQDPEAKSVLQQTITDYNTKQTRLAALESQLQSNELVDKSVAKSWRDFNPDQRLAEIKALREQVATLKPEADRAAVLAKQLEGNGGADPKDITPLVEANLKGKFVPIDQIDVIVKKAVDEATRNVNFGSLPTGLKMLEYADRARREFGLDIPLETFSEAVSRHGSVERAFDGLTADKAREKREAEAKAIEARHQAEVEAARKDGYQKATHDFETRTYNPEESGMSGVTPLVPPSDGDTKGVDPSSYNPTDGVVAREAGKILQKQESEGLWGKQLM